MVVSEQRIDTIPRAALQTTDRIPKLKDFEQKWAGWDQGGGRTEAGGRWKLIAAYSDEAGRGLNEPAAREGCREW